MNQQQGLLTHAFAIFRSSPALYIGITALPYATLHAGLLLLFAAFLRTVAGPHANLRTVWLTMTTANKLEFMALFLLWITVPYAVAGRGVCRIASGQIAGRETTLLKEAGDMLRFVPSAVTLGTIAGIVAFFGAAFFLIPGFISGGVLSLALPDGAAESIGPFAALRLAVSAAWRVFGRVVLLFLAYSALVFAAWVSQGIAFTAVPQFFEVFAIRTLIYLVCSFIPIVPLALLQICFTLLYLEARRPIEVPAAVRA